MSVGFLGCLDLRHAGSLGQACHVQKVEGGALLSPSFLIHAFFLQRLRDMYAALQQLLTPQVIVPPSARERF